MPAADFDAFISYRRSDGTAVAFWLRRELERFRAPRSFGPKFRRKLRVYLDTTYERGTSDFYEENVKPALLSARYLFVVATPQALRRPGAAADWIEQEINDFAGGPNGRNIVAVRGGGEFDPLPGDLQRRFPHIQIVDLRGAGRFWLVNPVRAARLSAEKVKLIAPLLDIPPEAMPKLRQEEERAQQVLLAARLGPRWVFCLLSQV